MLIGGGAIVLGKIFGPRILDYFSGSSVTAEKDFGNFKVSDSKKELIISDKNGEEILIIDKQN